MPAFSDRARRLPLWGIALFMFTDSLMEVRSYLKLKKTGQDIRTLKASSNTVAFRPDIAVLFDL